MTNATTEPVIVLGIDTPIGLAVVRELGRFGVPVHGIARDKRGIGLYSRYLTAGYVRPRGSDALLELIRRIATDAGARLVMTVSEADIAFLNRHADDLPGIRALVPDGHCMAKVVNKDSAYELARKAGIDVPRTWTVDNAEAVDAVVEAATFPSVLKWSNPNEVVSRLGDVGLPVHKAEFCLSADQLRRALGRYDGIGYYPLIQEYCSGRGLGQMVFMHKGESLLRFQHRRLHEWPPEGGFSTVCEAVPLDRHADLFERSVTMLREIGWEGPAMVEYRHDDVSGRSVFMEINGRFWGSLPLAYHARVPFAWFTYAVLGLGIVPEAPAPRFDLRCRFMMPEVRRLYRILFEQSRIQDPTVRFGRLRSIAEFLAGYVDPKGRYFVFAPDDPRPCLVDLGFAARRMVGR